MNRLASDPAPAPTPAPAAAAAHTHDQAEKITDHDKFDGSREKLKSFKDQLMLKTSVNAARFPNTQHKLRHVYQFLTGKVQRTMRNHLRKSTDDSGEGTFEIIFDCFAAFLAALDRHFGDPDKKHTAALALDKLRQANREFGEYYTDFQELMDIFETTGDTSRRHALKRRLNHEMLNALTIYTAPKDESFDEYIERRRTQGLCMYCGGVGHFAAECPARHTGTTAGTSGRRELAGVRATMTPISDSDSESGKEEAQE